MVTQTQFEGKDVFARTFDADEESLGAISERLEARGRHVFFAQVIGHYMDALLLSRNESILDLGCGTGVIARALTKRCDVKGRITAIDISPRLIEVARCLASDEGVADRIDFLVGDAHSIVEPQGRFDVVIMHTLLSHVVDPAAVLHEAYRLLRPGGRIVVFDGDFESLTFATDAPDGGAETDRLLGVSGHVQGRVMRLMPQLLTQTGFRLEWSRAYVAADIGRADFWASSVPTFRTLLPKSGVMSYPDANDYADKLERASARNEFFASCNFYTNIGRRTESRECDDSAQNLIK
ncbi:methyltransferase domain-containing protein [Paraburkholderia rhizosphaerae]|nr:methyltransferase domain-containing protein [Paraburkholderia rhizosphaerae]